MLLAREFKLKTGQKGRLTGAREQFSSPVFWLLSSRDAKVKSQPVWNSSTGFSKAKYLQVEIYV